MVGKANEIPVKIQGIDTTALLDSGSQISTIPEWFIKEHWPDLTVDTLEDFLDVEDAGGNSLKYSGVVTLELEPFPQAHVSVETPFLVVKETRYNRVTPLVVGTNVIDYLTQCYSDIEGLCTGAWGFASRASKDRVSALGSDGNVGVVRTCKQVVVPANSQVTVHGISRPGPVGKVLALSEEGDYGTLPGGLILLPTVSSICSYSNSAKRVGVLIRNISGKEVTIPNKTQLCELRQVSMVAPDSNSVSKIGSQSPPLVHKRSVVFSDFDRDNFLDQFNLKDTELDGNQRAQVEDLLVRWQGIFAKNDLDLGHTTTVKHDIKLTDDKPIKERYRRIPPGLQEEVRNHLKEMLDCGVIRPSHSPYAAPVVLVRKKDKSLRFCVDFRSLNSKTIKDAHSLPRIEETLDALSGSRCFSTLDLKAGYWQVEVAEQDKQKTAFTVGPLGFYEFNRLPFGLSNAPATFQRLMETSMGDLYLTQCLLYLDDIIVYSADFDQHLERLENVFRRLSDHGLKLKPSKCTLFHSEVKYLGHVIGKDGIKTDPEKIATVKDWPVPQNVKDLRKFLGFSGFYRKFVKDYSKIARPLYSLLKGPLSKGRKRVSDSSFVWGEDQEKAFHHLIECLTSAPVLGYADYSLPFELHIDASLDGLGAVLCQNQDGQSRVIAYASRGLSMSECRYPAHKLEFLSLKWAITEKFRDYLYCHRFTVHTDNNPLTYVLSTAKLDATGHRWLSELANFDFDIKYRSGKVNRDADALSRLHSQGADSQTVSIPQNITFSVCNVQSVPAVETLGANPSVVPEIPSGSMTAMTAEEWIAHQKEDSDIADLIGYLEGGLKVDPKSKVVKQMLRDKKRFCFKHGVLYRERVDAGEQLFQLVLPARFRLQALQGVHDQVGHMGQERTLDLLQRRFYWPAMGKDVESYVKTCLKCIQRKARQQTTGMISITTSQPMELVCMDFLSLEESKGSYKNILVISDHFTRYAIAVPTRNQTAKTTANILFKQFICHYGFPQRIQ